MRDELASQLLFTLGLRRGITRHTFPFSWPTLYSMVMFAPRLSLGSIDSTDFNIHTRC